MVVALVIECVSVLVARPSEVYSGPAGRDQAVARGYRRGRESGKILILVLQ